MILAVDIGNSYLKFKAWKAGKMLVKGRMKYEEITVLPGVLQGQTPDRIIISCVGSQEIVMEIEGLFQGSEITLVKSCQGFLGVLNGYFCPERLGVDRWVAVVESYHHSGRKPCLVLDLGTALTLDLVDGAGCHQGGYIVPGILMMRQSLLSSTENVRFDPSDEIALGYGVDTSSAVVNGTVAMVIAWLTSEISRFNMKYPLGVVYVTGGLAPHILSHLPQNVIYYEDMLLDGLHRIALN